MQRYNSFNIIHKALRAMLYDTALTLQQTHFPDAEEAETALTKVETVIEHFEHHAHHEDTFILPAIEAFEPHLVEAFENEHVEDMELGNRLKTLLNIFRAVESDEEKINAGSAISKAFRDFMTFNLSHMAKEESEINQALWKHYTDQELIELNERLTANIPQERKMMVAKWMLRGINKFEAVTWLKAVKHSSPSFVFQSLYELTETELPAQIRDEVQDAVLEIELLN
jgi:hypothetical protein